MCMHVSVVIYAHICYRWNGLHGSLFAGTVVSRAVPLNYTVPTYCAIRFIHLYTYIKCVVCVCSEVYIVICTYTPYVIVCVFASCNDRMVRILAGLILRIKTTVCCILQSCAIVSDNVI